MKPLFFFLSRVGYEQVRTPWMSDQYFHYQMTLLQMSVYLKVSTCLRIFLPVPGDMMYNPTNAPSLSAEGNVIEDPHPQLRLRLYYVKRAPARSVGPDGPQWPPNALASCLPGASLSGLCLPASQRGGGEGSTRCSRSAGKPRLPARQEPSRILWSGGLADDTDKSTR